MDRGSPETSHKVKFNQQKSHVEFNHKLLSGAMSKTKPSFFLFFFSSQFLSWDKNIWIPSRAESEGSLPVSLQATGNKLMNNGWAMGIAGSQRPEQSSYYEPLGSFSGALVESH